MDAKYYTAEPGTLYGDDEDRLDPAPEPHCASCGARPEEPCTPECACAICLQRAARRDEQVSA
jgi:hypothetical protein